MNGFNIAEGGHVVQILPPVDITGGKIAQAFSMAEYAHASILVLIGVSAAAFTKIIVSIGTATAAIGTAVAGATAIPFMLYKQETAGANEDVLDGGTLVAATGYTPSANDGIFYVIELDARALEAAAGELGTDPYVQLSLTNGSNSVIASAVAILSGARAASLSSPTVTT
jgi:hypothetical protein